MFSARDARIDYPQPQIRILRQFVSMHSVSEVERVRLGQYILLSRHLCFNLICLRPEQGVIPLPQKVI